jgi:hypothetical protein
LQLQFVPTFGRVADPGEPLELPQELPPNGPIAIKADPYVE